MARFPDPAIPPFEESGKYPEVMSATSGFSRVTAFRTTRRKIILAAFVGEDAGCRDVDRNRWAQSVPALKYEVKKGENAPVYFMYYSLQTSGIYKASESFPFADEGVKGSEEEPFTISLQPVVN